jgi:hypothetical protein
MKRTRRKQNEKSEILGEREEKGFGFWVFFLGAVTAENDAMSLSLSFLSRRIRVCARTRILSEKKGGNRLKRKN